MRKTLLICTCGVMIGSASAASLVWNGGESGAWGTAGNWIDSGTGSAPASVPSGNISSAAANTYTLNGHVNITEGSMFNNGNQTIVITNGSSVTLSDATANGTARRFDGVFHIEEGATLTVGTSYFYGASQIYGTLIVCTQFAPPGWGLPGFWHLRYHEAFYLQYLSWSGGERTHYEYQRHAGSWYGFQLRSGSAPIV